MALVPGARVGPYEVISLLGAGGMGEVYRARDTKLNRDVALKVLPEAFALDPDRLARFKREAQVLAALNHSNIAAIHGFEDSGQVHALVLELVEGPTLADRIAQGPLPLDEALPIASQIAEALAAAHEHGIVHRDLKPANIKLRDDGTVKVLDFGLAKALEGESLPSDISMSPTLSVAATRAGVILGTAAYMAPEQARGKAVDRRRDIWAFGCVLYEMLTGKRAFEGEEVSDTLAAILRGEPDWSKVHARVERLLRACLEKDRKRRLQAIGDYRLLLDEVAAVAPTARRPLAWIAATVGAVLVALTIGTIHFRERPPSEPIRRLSVAMPDEAVIGFLALSPDGRELVVRFDFQPWRRALQRTARPPSPEPGTGQPTAAPWSRTSASIFPRRVRSAP
jgi:serine/threonine protein kinase